MSEDTRCECGKRLHCPQTAPGTALAFRGGAAFEVERTKDDNGDCRLSPRDLCGGEPGIGILCNGVDPASREAVRQLHMVKPGTGDEPKA